MATEAVSPERTSTAFRNSNERLYEAYNDLHSLAQDFEKPFDAPAILVIGHQTDGKSGEALRPLAATSPLTVLCCMGSCHRPSLANKNMDAAPLERLLQQNTRSHAQGIRDGSRP